MQLRFASFAVINLRRDSHPQECARAGRTMKNGPAMPARFAFGGRAYSIALTMSSTTFFASPNTIMVLSM
jgi:hypothetical protein